MLPLFFYETSIKFPLDYFCYMQIFVSTSHNLYKLQQNDPSRQTIHIFDKPYVISCLYFFHIKRNDPAFSSLQHWFLLKQLNEGDEIYFISTFQLIK